MKKILLCFKIIGNSFKYAGKANYEIESSKLLHFPLVTLFNNRKISKNDGIKTANRPREFWSSTEKNKWKMEVGYTLVNAEQAAKIQ